VNKTEISNQKLSPEEFEGIRQCVLDKWPTLKKVDFDDAVEFHKNLPIEKNLFHLIHNAYNQGKSILYPRGGTALLDDQIELLLYLQNNGGADYLPTTVDSYTRNEKFKDAQLGIDLSRKEGRSMLNGFPMVNYGVEGGRQIINRLDVPAMVLPGTPIVRTIAEVAFASGYTGLLGSAISDTLRFTKNLTLAEGISFYQYVDRLVSLYGERNISIHREHTTFLTGTLIPPGLAIAVFVLDCLLAANQGVKQYSIGLGQNLCVFQDVAALKISRIICRKYLDIFGYSDVTMPVGSHHWMGAFPQDAAESFSIIAMGTIIAVLGNATHITTKTPQEAVGIPTMKSNAEGVRCSKKIIKMMRKYRLPDDSAVKHEMEIIEAEATCIIDKVLEIGDGDPAKGAIRGAEAGVLDIPWAPNMHIANKVMPARDHQGAVRYFDSGGLPLAKEVKQFHQECLRQRSLNENRQVELDMAIEDVMEISSSVLGDAGA
jgi:methylaspartate mutase epsilon subunit